MKLNLTESFANLENALAAQLLQNIETQRVQDPRHFLAGEVRLADTMRLDKGEFWSGDEVNADPVTIECVNGCVWLTLGSGLLDDVLLLPDRTYVTRPGDHVLVEALEDSLLRIRSACE